MSSFVRQPCQRSQGCIPTISILISQMAGLLRRLKDLQDEDSLGTPSQTPQQRRACAGWHALMLKVLELIMRFQEESMREARRAMSMGQAWQRGGLPSGSLPHVGSMPKAPPLPVLREPLNKQDELEDKRIHGVPLPPRNSRYHREFLQVCACIPKRAWWVQRTNTKRRFGARSVMLDGRWKPIQLQQVSERFPNL